MPAGAPTPTPPPKKRWWLVVVAVVVVVLVVLAVLALAGVFTPSSRSGPGVVGVPVYYSQVASSGADVVSAQGGGPWTLVAVEGFSLSSSASGANVAGSVGSGCTATPAPGSPSSSTLPATPGGSPPGTAAAWLFLAIDPNGTMLFVVATENSSYPLMLIDGSCTSEFGDLGSLAGLTVVNSTQVATSANANGGSVFLGNNAGVLQIYGLFGSGLGGYDNPLWAVEYNTCGLSTSGTGTVFIGLYNAVDGTLETTPGTESVSC
jgi:hypothetical protein